MSNHWPSAEAVAALLKDLKTLRAQRTAIDTEIARIEAFLGPAALGASDDAKEAETAA